MLRLCAGRRPSAHNLPRARSRGSRRPRRAVRSTLPPPASRRAAMRRSARVPKTARPRALSRWLRDAMTESSLRRRLRRVGRSRQPAPLPRAIRPRCPAPRPTLAPTFRASEDYCPMHPPFCHREGQKSPRPPSQALFPVLSPAPFPGRPEARLPRRFRPRLRTSPGSRRRRAASPRRWSRSHPATRSAPLPRPRLPALVRSRELTLRPCAGRRPSVQKPSRVLPSESRLPRRARRSTLPRRASPPATTAPRRSLRRRPKRTAVHPRLPSPAG